MTRFISETNVTDAHMSGLEISRNKEINKGQNNERDWLSLSLVILFGAFAMNIAEAQDDSRMTKFVPTEIFACTYKEGKGPGFLLSSTVM